MPIQRINEFPEGSGSLSNDDVFLFMDDPSGSSVTKKISLSQISSAIGGGGGGNPFDQNLNTTDFPTFSGVNLSNNSSLAEGSFDSGVGGNGGISLNCTVGYELNWQAGHLKSTADSGVTAEPIYFDSPITYSPTVVSLTFDTTLSTDCSLGEVFDVTLTDNITLANPTNPVNGKTIRWRILQDGNGNRGVTLGDKFVIPSSATSPLPWSTAANKMDIFAATYHSGRDKWDVVAFVPGY
jgi:hypothetical protein